VKTNRRILRTIAENPTDRIGVTATLTDPGMLDALVKGKQ
jgi:hypothetical protein